MFSDSYANREALRGPKPGALPCEPAQEAELFPHHHSPWVAQDGVTSQQLSVQPEEDLVHGTKGSGKRNTFFLPTNP